MLISFTQTYGNRKELIDIYLKDNKLKEFKNNFDINYYSFHNSPPEIIKYFTENNKVKNTKILEFNNICYTQCIKNLKTQLNNDNCSRFFWTQDDSFSNDINVDFTELLRYFTSFDNNFMLCFKQMNKFKRKLLHKLESLNIYDTTSIDFAEDGQFSLDDSPYLCTIDMFNKIYDETYFSYVDIWKAEGYLNNRFKKEIINRFSTDKNIFKNYNILGRNNWNRANEIKNLINKGLI
jgi:hypothetical protein